MHGTVSWVTGGGRGIGAGVAQALAARGATVWITSRTTAECVAVVEAIRRAGGRAEAAPGDVADQAQMQAVAGRIAAHGDGRLDHLVCSAGVGLFGALLDADPGDLDRLLAVNVRGTLLCAQAAAGLMRPRREGSIIGIASVMALTAYRNQGAYAASKHAMLGLLKALGKELQPDGIRVTCLCPGAVDTAMVRASRPDLQPGDTMEVADVADAVLWLLNLSGRCAVDLLSLRRRGAEPFTQ